MRRVTDACATRLYTKRRGKSNNVFPTQGKIRDTCILTGLKWPDIWSWVWCKTAGKSACHFLCGGRRKKTHPRGCSRREGSHNGAPVKKEITAGPYRHPLFCCNSTNKVFHLHFAIATTAFLAVLWALIKCFPVAAKAFPSDVFGHKSVKSPELLYCVKLLV